MLIAHKEIEDYLLSLPNTKLDYPFGENTAVSKISLVLILGLNKLDATIIKIPIIAPPPIINNASLIGLLVLGNLKRRFGFWSPLKIKLKSGLVFPTGAGVCCCASGGISTIVTVF
jgi:hypothetical protein